MSHRLRIVGLLAFVTMALVGYWFWHLRQPSAPGSSMSVAPPRVVDEALPKSSATAAPADKTDSTTAIMVASPARPNRLPGLPLPETLRRPGLNTVADALAQIAEMDESVRADYFQALVLFCLQNDAPETANLLASLDDEKQRDLGLSFALLHWAESDPVAALRWAAEHPRGENDHSRYHAAYEGFASQHPLEALQTLQNDEFAGDRDELSRVVIFHFAQQDKLTEARTWIEQLPEGNLRELLIRQTVHAWAQQAPADAANWLASIASDATFRAGMGTLMQTLAENDPHFAAGLTQRFAEPEIREGQLADVIYLWAKRDLGGAAAWLREQPPSPQLDAAIGRMVDATAPNDPVEARQWANALSDPKKREEALARLRQ